MVSTEERMRILNMLQEGQVTPEQAAQLLQALDESPVASKARPAAQPRAAQSQIEHFPAVESGHPPRWLRVRVTDTDSGRPRVNVRLPLSLVNVGLKMGKQFAPEIEGMDFNEIFKAIQDGETGTFVDVYDDDDGEHVEVFLE
jgi:hypothetical protein